MKILISVLFLLACAFSAQAQIPEQIRKIYSYGCNARFLEGESVTPNSIACSPFQHLGFYRATYHYYLYESDTEDNFSTKPNYRNYPAPVCGLNLDAYSCVDSEPQLQFALAEGKDSTFNIAITLLSNPDWRSGFFAGYAAMPDSNGDCADGLVRVQAGVAYVPSINYPLPSNLYNVDGRFNDMQLIVADRSLDPFELVREPARTPCDRYGNCHLPDGEAYLHASISYRAEGPTVCAIPADRVR